MKLKHGCGFAAAAARRREGLLLPTVAPSLRVSGNIWSLRDRPAEAGARGLDSVNVRAG